MVDVVTRIAKGSILSWQEVDDNFINLATAIDGKVDSSLSLLRTSNLADLQDIAAARTNLQLRSAALHDATDFTSTSTFASFVASLGSAAYVDTEDIGTAVISGLATVATTGQYSDLLGKPALAPVATSGAYADLTGKPDLSVRIATPAYASSMTLDASAYDIYRITLTGPLNINFNNGTDGKIVRLGLKQDATGGRVLTLGTSINVGSDIPTVTLSTIANKRDIIAFQYNSVSGKFDLISYARGY